MAQRGKMIYAFLPDSDKRKFSIKCMREGRGVGETMYLLAMGYLTGKFKLGGIVKNEKIKKENNFNG